MRKSLLESMAPFHLVGGGGVGMSAIARILLEHGWPVSISDRSESETLADLARAGARVQVGHDPSVVPGSGTVIANSAIRADNPELKRAQALGVPVLHRAQILNLIAGDSETIAVTGTHGKSTTTAMIAHILYTLGRDPTALVGADVLAWGSNARSGSGFTVVEADESDGSLCWLSPTIAVITNLEADHLDHYRDLDEIVATMAAFLMQMPPGGRVVAGTQSPGLSTLLSAVTIENLSTFGPGGDLVVSAEGPLVYRGADLPLELDIPGLHNRQNAAAAILACIAADVDAKAAAAALADFRGIGRRFEERGTVRNIRVVDDYAHHPTEVAAVLSAARSLVGDSRVIAVFEPHLFTRTRDFATELCDALEAADLVGVLPIYPAREDPIEGVTSALVIRGTFVPLDDFHAAAKWVVTVARPGDLVLTLGAGPVTALGPRILAELEEVSDA